jgi:beta-N-acetylhexosaminidase
MVANQKRAQKGPKVGNIGCVGVDAAHRKGGVGQGMLAAALQEMKARGLEGVFVDSAVLRSWYEKAGFLPWREYKQAKEI